ncbi:uncharacterized protein LOC101853172 isoform X2 [Aplysia californica]|nr:uncharacterized protein LOC101853172 isoform X2 [Aplysia californica]XP_012939595.1 uncharacterized protein LOC101853172 isoform X2 [Aplysia californica]XP_012939596.1 uncharacterized protein LOC101853172 isoform X2 [Aplysia californica]XP_035826390.1 uncharacterized protein LOC101853172 isoform X2 [Aplysia californica]
MYGYHAQEEQFLKIYLYNPNNVRKAADLLLGGAVMSKPYQPHESHIPYALQLFIDYNLYGMNLINVSALKFRKRGKAPDAPRDESGTDNGSTCQSAALQKSLSTSSSSSCPRFAPITSRVWHDENIPSDMWLPSSVERQSTCELEVDVVAADILNRQELESNVGANPGLAALWEDEKQRKRDAGESSLIEPESSQARGGVECSESEKLLVQRFLALVQEQQAFRDSQSEESGSSQPSLSASQLERHVSREDSSLGSPDTVILGELSENEDMEDDEDAEHPPIINMDSIKKVVSFSQSFSARASDDPAQQSSQDKTVAEVLASLLEENGAPPSQLRALEEQDSILSQSLVLGEEEEKEDEEETMAMTQSVFNVDEKDDGPSTSKDVTLRKSDDDDDIVMGTDEESSDDEIDLLPQFDGASDKISGSMKKSDKSGSSSTQSPALDEVPSNQSLSMAGRAGGSGAGGMVADMTWGSGRSQGAGGSGSQGSGYPVPAGASSWSQQPGAWGSSPQVSGSSSSSGWQEQPGGSGSSQWTAQHHQYPAGWPSHHSSSRQQLQQGSPVASQYMSHQHMPFRSPTPTNPHPFHSPSHNRYAASPSSQTQSQQGQPSSSQQPAAFQSPSSSPHSFQFSQSPYQSPSSSQGVQDPFHSPSSSQLPYQSSSHLSQQQQQHYQSRGQPYHSPSASQPYHSPPSNLPPPYQSPSATPSYQSPTSATHPYQSPGGGQMYPSPYQSPSHQPFQASPRQPFAHPYQSPTQGASSSPAGSSSSRYPGPPTLHSGGWSPQAYNAYYHGSSGGGQPPGGGGMGSSKQHQQPPPGSPHALQQARQSPHLASFGHPSSSTQPPQTQQIAMSSGSSGSSQHAGGASLNHVVSSPPSQQSAPSSSGPAVQHSLAPGSSSAVPSGSIGSAGPSSSVLAPASGSGIHPGVMSHMMTTGSQALQGKSAQLLTSSEGKMSPSFKSPQPPSHSSPLHTSGDRGKVNHTSMAHAVASGVPMGAGSPSMPQQSQHFSSQGSSQPSSAATSDMSLLSVKAQSDGGSVIPGSGENSNAVMQTSPSSKNSEAQSITRISTLDFKPKAKANLEKRTDEDSKSKSDKSLDNTSATPMIQQLLSEESPARMNITQEEREAAIKKPMLSPTLPKSKKKSKSKGGQSGKSRPRSTSMSFPMAPVSPGYPSYCPPQPMMNPHMLARPGRSHSISLPFSTEQRMHHGPGGPEYSWQQQQQWKQQNFCGLPSQWQQQQQQQQAQHQQQPQLQQQQQQPWGPSPWQNYGSVGSPVNSQPGSSATVSPVVNSRLQQRSFSADSAQPGFFQNSYHPQQNQIMPSCSNNSQTSSTAQDSPLSQHHHNQVTTTVTAATTTESKVAATGEEAEENDKSSLSSLLQLVSDVGSAGEGPMWDSGSSTVVPNLFPSGSNGGELETNKSSPVMSELNQGSPSIKDFITLETAPSYHLKHPLSYEPAGSDTTGVTSSEESDKVESDIAADIKPLLKGVGAGGTMPHSRLGKHNRMKKMGLAHGRLWLSGQGEGGANPSYTYTFHVPTPVFKKLKFFKSPEARRHSVKVVRMHPMDARRYSLLKIGREVVKVVKLTEEDLARYNVTLPLPSRNPDGSSNRVNLDIPSVSMDRKGFDSSSDDGGLSKFDTDFPPNKVAPPSSFHVSQVSASLSRASSSVSRNQIVTASAAINNNNASYPDWTGRQFQGQQQQQPLNYNGGSQHLPHHQGASPSYVYQSPGEDRNFRTFPMHSPGGSGSYNMNCQFPPQSDRVVAGFPQSSPKDDHFNSPGSATSSVLPMGTFYSSQQLGAYSTNHPQYPQPPHPHFYPSHRHPHPQHHPHHQFQQVPSGQYPQPQLAQQQQQYAAQQGAAVAGYPNAQMESKNELRSPGQHGPVSTIDSGSVSGHSGEEEEAALTAPQHHSAPTTGTFPVNTRVNALKGENHAEHLATATTTTAVTIVHRRLCASTRESGSSSQHAPQIEPNTDSHDNHICEGDRCIQCATMTQGDRLELNCDKFRRKVRRKRRKKSRLSLKRTVPSCRGTADSVNESLKPEVHASEFFHNHQDSDHNCDVKDCSAAACNAEENQFTMLKPDVNLNDSGVLDRKLRSKNVKSLHLKIPKSVWEGGSAAAPGTSSANSLATMGRLSVSSSHKETSDDGASADCEFLPLYPRSLRRARMPSVSYSSLKSRQPRKKQEPVQKEGVHYIVVGKFKGYKSMQVQIERVNVVKGDVVDARHYEEIAKKSIVRRPSGSCVENGLSGLLNRSATSENNRHCEESNFVDESGPDGQPTGSLYKLVSAKKKKKVKPGRRKMKKRLKNGLRKSSQISSSEVLPKDAQTKNVEAGPFPQQGASEISFNSLPSSHDVFFYKFKEYFIRKHHEKETISAGAVQQSIATFFPNVGEADVERFRQKFEINMTKHNHEEFSSSSDDEDDFLDDLILKGKILELKANQLETSCEQVRDNEQSESIRETAVGTKELCEESREQQISGAQPIYIRTPDDDTVSPSIPESKTHCVDVVTPTDVDNVLPCCERSQLPSPIQESEDEKLIFTPSSLPNPVELNSSAEKGEGRDDYLKSQMAFFEDISSDSDSNNTIIVDGVPGKESASFTKSLTFSPIAAYSARNTAEISPPTEQVPFGLMGPFGRSVTDPLGLETAVAQCGLEVHMGTAGPRLQRSESVVADPLVTDPLGLETPVNNTCSMEVLMQDASHGSQKSESAASLTTRQTSLVEESASQDCPLSPSLGAAVGCNFHRPSVSVSESSPGQSPDQSLVIDDVPEPSGAQIAVMASQQAAQGDTGATTEGRERKWEKASSYDVAVSEINSSKCMDDNNDGCNAVKSLDDHEEVHEVDKTAHMKIKVNLVTNAIVKKIPSVTESNTETSKEVCSEKETIPVKEENSGKRKTVKILKGRIKSKNNKKVPDYHSSSNEDSDVAKHSVCLEQSKRLRQRKQVRYTFCPEEIGTSDEFRSSSDDDVSDSSVTRKKGKRSKKTRARGSQKNVVVLQEQRFRERAADKDNASATCSNPVKSNVGSRATRGKKKKMAGGGKLFNSLSLLHMATLANLTEVQGDGDAENHQSVSEVAADSDDVVPSQYSDSASMDHEAEYSSSLENMSFISPHTSEEWDASPPLAFSPTDKKKKSGKEAGGWRGGRGRGSRRFLNFQPRLRQNIRPGLNGASNLGTKPLPFSRLVNSSASSSPVPSNFTFNHTSMDAVSLAQNEIVPASEDANSSNIGNTLHLLETKRAQVNCASFSMKDILRLTTSHEDSMDSDSKDSAAVCKPPEPRRAQVKSTSLSMSDILKLTNSENAEVDDGNGTQASTSLLSQLANFTVPKEQGMGMDKTGDEDAPQASNSLLSQMANFCNPVVDRKQSVDSEDGEVTQASKSLLSQLKDFSLPQQEQNEKITVDESDSTTQASDFLLSQMANFSAPPQSYKKETHKGGEEPTQISNTFSSPLTRPSVPQEWIQKGTRREDIREDVQGSSLKTPKEKDIEKVECKYVSVENLPSADKSCTYENLALHVTSEEKDSCKDSTCEDTCSKTDQTSSEVKKALAKHSSSLLKDKDKSTADSTGEIDGKEKAQKKSALLPVKGLVSNADNDVKELSAVKKNDNHLSLVSNSPSENHSEMDAKNISLLSSGRACNGKISRPVTPDVDGGSCKNSKDELLSSEKDMSPRVSLISLEHSLSPKSRKDSISRELRTENETEVKDVQHVTESKTVPNTQRSEGANLDSTEADVVPETQELPASVHVPRILISHVADRSPADSTEPPWSLHSISQSQGIDPRQIQPGFSSKPSQPGLQPLNPLQIPAYPAYSGQAFPTAPASGQSYSGSAGGGGTSSYYSSYPFCWQWPAPATSADALTSPLNLCTSKRSPNNYSPITPTSPVSPFDPVPQPPSSSGLMPAKLMSPPLKKVKPLWYPWLSVDKSSAAEKGVSSEMSKSVVASSQVANPKHMPKSHSVNTPVHKVQHSSPHRIENLLSDSPSKPSLKVNKASFSSCKTVSQLVGTVIESAYPPRKGNGGGSVSSKEKVSSYTSGEFSLNHVPLKAAVPSPLSKPVMEQPQFPGSLPATGHQGTRQGERSWSNHMPQTATYNVLAPRHQQHPSFVSPSYGKQNGVCAAAVSTTLSSNRHPHQSYSNDLRASPGSTAPAPRPRHHHEDKRIRTMLENEKILRGQFGLGSPHVPPSSSSLSPNSASQRERPSLTDLVVTKLIKGNEPEYNQNEPFEASRGKKRKTTGNRTGGSQSSSSGGDGPSLPASSEGRRRGNSKSRGERDENGELENRKISSVPSDGERTLCPVKPPPRRAGVENSMTALGLNSVQPPSAYCSVMEDLPDKPMELGGRVLKVDSRRLSELEPFPPCCHINGIRAWRSQSLRDTTILASQQADGKPLWDRVQHEPQMRFLLSADHPVAVSPCVAPPSRHNVVRWLKQKMASVKQARNSLSSSTKLKADSKAYKQNSGTSSKEKDKRKAVTFSQLNFTVDRLEDEELDSNTSKIALDTSGLSDSILDDSSTLVDTDLDLSCTPVGPTPAPVNTSKSDCGSQTKTSATTSTPVSSHKRKLRFSTESTASGSSDGAMSPPDHSLDEHSKNVKKARAAESSSESRAPVSCSTPVRRESHDMFDPSCTPIVSPPSGKPGQGEPTDSNTTPVVRRISTNTENVLRRNVLQSQTQRQFSVLGFTAAENSQIEGPTPKNTFGFKVAQDHLQNSKALHKHQYVTALSMELHIETRGDLRPDPEFDLIQSLFYSVFDDIPDSKGKRNIVGVLVVDPDSWQAVTDRSAKGMTTQKSDHSGASDNSRLDDAGVGFSAAPYSSSVPTCGGGKGQGMSAETLAAEIKDTAASSSLKPATPSSPTPTTSKARPVTPTKGKGRGKGRGSSSRSVSPAGPRRGQSNGPSAALLEKCAVEGVEVTYVQDEMDLIHTFVELMARFDPDILVGFEVQMLSWGYLLQRSAQLGVDLCSRLARVPDAKDDNRYSAEKDEWGADHMSEIHIAGRVVLNLWRILRHEVTLNTYTFENVAFHVLHQRIPLFSFRSLSKWYNHKTHLHRWRVFEHYVRRVKGQLEIIDQLDLIGKTSEFARVFGIEFYDVLARGTQIRVESMMLRLAKPMNYVPVSPSVTQRARQKAAECIPLTLEPESKYYTSPVVVLDFQSLYPSIMIAYNYCFSTCLGRLDLLEKAHEGPFEFGCTSLKLTPSVLKKVKDRINVSPNGVAFVKPSVRRGVLPKMVEEILNTRIMVKKSMKSCKNDKTLTRMLDARQLGLKLIANVTYGYTGASFSGRMPCIEVGDSIVRKARESLERAIQLVEQTPRWGASVIYGDTDSLFIHFPGRSKDEAFVLGQEIADAVTAMFPSPMKLKFEKVYLPCVLQTKKRYVGFMYETPDQTEPVFDAKGIETVRRDACSAVSKILERSIKVLFTTHDLSRVRAYVTRQLHKLLEGKVSIIDLIFAKEFRGLMGYKPGACVPALEIARKRLRVDRQSEPRVGERVPYVIVHGSPGLPLIQLVREPEELLHDPGLRLNATYYITKQILPPLDRLFSLIGVNVFKWYQDMPKVMRVGPMMGAAAATKQGTISQFFATTNCPVCDSQTKTAVCSDCRKDPQLVVSTLTHRLQEWDRTFYRLAQVCVMCQGVQDGEQSCTTIDCPIVFRRIIAQQDMLRADNLRDVLDKFLQY